MGPKPTMPSSGDLYRSRLDQILDQRHELYRLAALIDWHRFDHEFGRFYRPLGRPAKPTRLMVGLSYLQHTFNLSDEAVVQRWIENPYWQWFCGCEYFQHELPCDPSSLTRWRKRLGPEGLETLLAATIQTGLDSGAVRPSCGRPGGMASSCVRPTRAWPNAPPCRWAAMLMPVRCSACGESSSG
jgi:IS5 family transposase